MYIKTFNPLLIMVAKAKDMYVPGSKRINAALSIPFLQEITNF